MAIITVSHLVRSFPSLTDHKCKSCMFMTWLIVHKSMRAVERVRIGGNLRAVMDIRIFKILKLSYSVQCIEVMRVVSQS